jgi:hypothetical protein
MVVLNRVPVVMFIVENMKFSSPVDGFTAFTMVPFVDKTGKVNVAIVKIMARIMVFLQISELVDLVMCFFTFTPFSDSSFSIVIIVFIKVLKNRRNLYECNSIVSF